MCTEQAPEPENEKMNGQQYRKWDFALPVLVPVLEMGCQFPVLVIAQPNSLKKNTLLGGAGFGLSRNFLTESECASPFLDLLTRSLRTIR